MMFEADDGNEIPREYKSKDEEDGDDNCSEGAHGFFGLPVVEEEEEDEMWRRQHEFNNVNWDG